MADVTGDPTVHPATELASLVEQLQADRLWLLRQIDGGRWAPWRLDLAALERELGQLLELADQRIQSGSAPLR